jgi:predicted DsbA family dithiol-disulfide isomerase
MPAHALQRPDTRAPARLCGSLSLKSASERSTLLAAAADAGLDAAAAAVFLDTDELSREVWQSYGETIQKYGIHAIPYFVFR